MASSANLTIEVNHKNNAYRVKARELLTSDDGLINRSKRPIESEAVFGNIKFNHGFKRFRLKSTEKIAVEWGLVAIAHNLRKYIAQKKWYITSKIIIICFLGAYIERKGLHKSSMRKKPMFFSILRVKTINVTKIMRPSQNYF